MCLYRVLEDLDHESPTFPIPIHSPCAATVSDLNNSFATSHLVAMASAVDFGNGEKNSLDKSETTDHTPNGNNDLSHQETAQTVLTADKTQPDAHQLSTYLEGGAAAALSQEHRDYLLQRHGTLDLDPMPSDDPADPYNWPTWKVSGIHHHAKLFRKRLKGQSIF